MPLLLHGIMAPDGGPLPLRSFHPASSLAMLGVRHRREHEKSRLFLAVEPERSNFIYDHPDINIPGR